MTEMEDVQQNMLPQMQNMLNEMNVRLNAAEAQNQTLVQVLNNTQSELVSIKAQTPTVPLSSGLPKGVKTQAPDRFALGVGLVPHIPPLNISWILPIVTCVLAVYQPVVKLTTYVTLHLLEGEARTWYDLRNKTAMNESFDSFSSALKAHFTNHNSQRHYREALQSLSMKQFRDVMQYNQAFRQMMLCLEDMTELDKLSHYERGLETKYRVAVRQARCANVASAMAEVDIVADAHQANVVLPNIARNPASTPINTSPHMGVSQCNFLCFVKITGNRKSFMPRKDPVRDGTVVLHRPTLHRICLE